MRPEDRRIVVITGAGASTRLGLETDLPMMGDWSLTLRKDLDEAESGLADAIGLKAGLTAQEFEEALGAFTSFHSSVGLIERFVTLGGPQPGSLTGDSQNWLSLIKQRGTLVNETLNLSMFREFGRGSLSDEKAGKAFGWLLGRLGKNAKLVWATTNYDAAIEVGLQQLGRSPNDGFADTHWQRPVLDVAGLVSWEENHRGRDPVLHLHGAVGWYIDELGRIVRHYPDLSYNPTLGAPVFLPPDPSKDPLASMHVAAIWEEFKHALNGASHVLVLGHSLNDEPLVNMILSEGGHAEVLFTYHSEDQSAEPPDLGQRLIGAREGFTVHQAWAQFGPDPAMDQSRIESWLKRGTSDSGNQVPKDLIRGRLTRLGSPEVVEIRGEP